MRRIYIILLMVLATYNLSKAQVKILFDATEGESAGTSADWVIDADVANIEYNLTGGRPQVISGGYHDNPQRYPTPAQSTVTSSTAENYWDGGNSAWAIDMVKKGYEVETLTVFDSITYGNSSHAQDLSNYKVFIINEPQFQFSTSAKKALMNFVKNGGGLFMISDHTGASRTSNGWDAVMVWDDFILSNPVKDTAFGFIYKHEDVSPSSAHVNSSSSDSIIIGPMGTSPGMEWHDGTTATLYPTRNPTVTGDVFSGVVGDTGVMCGHGRYGKGKFAFIGDSSPTDDGSTTNSHCSLSNGWTGDPHGEEEITIVNATIWLATSNTVTAVNNISVIPVKFEVYPNPMNGTGRIKYVLDESGFVSLDMFDITGKLVKKIYSGQAEMGLNIANFESNDLTEGIYFLRLESDHLTQTQKVVITH
ncbi:MAG: T9SS type A sorting domain-containing protein [Bacteroidales bacterium]